jgi:hypothetical protein
MERATRLSSVRGINHDKHKYGSSLLCTSDQSSMADILAQTNDPALQQVMRMRRMEWFEGMSLIARTVQHRQLSKARPSSFYFPSAQRTDPSRLLFTNIGVLDLSAPAAQSSPKVLKKLDLGLEVVPGNVLDSPVYLRVLENRLGTDARRPARSQSRRAKPQRPEHGWQFVVAVGVEAVSALSPVDTEDLDEEVVEEALLGQRKRVQSVENSCGHVRKGVVGGSLLGGEGGKQLEARTKVEAALALEDGAAGCVVALAKKVADAAMDHGGLIDCLQIVSIVSSTSSAVS